MTWPPFICSVKKVDSCQGKQDLEPKGWGWNKQASVWVCVYIMPLHLGLLCIIHQQRKDESSYYRYLLFLCTCEKTKPSEGHVSSWPNTTQLPVNRDRIQEGFLILHPVCFHWLHILFCSRQTVQVVSAVSVPKVKKEPARAAQLLSTRLETFLGQYFICKCRCLRLPVSKSSG